MDTVYTLDEAQDIIYGVTHDGKHLSARGYIKEANCVFIIHGPASLCDDAGKLQLQEWLAHSNLETRCNRKTRQLV